MKKTCLLIFLYYCSHTILAQDTIYQVHFNATYDIRPRTFLKNNPHQFYAGMELFKISSVPNCCEAASVIKFTDHGLKLWQKTYYIDSSHLYLSFHHQLNENKYLLGSARFDLNTLVSSNLLIETDSNGNVLNARGLSKGETKAFTMLENDFYFSGGGSIDSVTNYGNLFVCKTDSLYQPLWWYDYPTNGDMHTRWKMKPFKDGSGVLLSGNYDDNPGGSDFAVLLKVDTGGSLIWSYRFDGGTNTGFNDLEALPDGGFLICGYTNDPGQFSGLLFKIDTAGNLVWSHEYNFNGFCNSIAFTSDGGLIISGTTLVAGDRFFLLKTDSLGNPEWMRYSFYNGHPVGAGQTLDGGYIYADNSGHNGGILNLHIAKTDSAGNMGCYDNSLTLTSHPSLIRTPITFAPSSSSFTVNPPTMVQVDTTSLPDSVLCAGVSGIAYHSKKEAQLDIYPNPNHGTFILELSQGFPSAAKIQIINTLGEIIHTTQFSKTDTKKEIKLNHISPGLYICRMININSVYQQQFVVH